MRYICSLPNPGEPGDPRELFTDDDALVERFAKAEGRPGRGVYECINPLVPGARRRCLETVAELRRFYFDLDLQHIEESRDTVLKRLEQLPLAPSWVRDSGNGNIHVGIEIKDPPIRGASEYDELAVLWKRLAEKLAADPAPTHPAALIRLLGTPNTKDGGNGLCRTLWASGAPIDISEVQALDELLARPLLTGKPRPKANGHAASGASDGPVDVERELTNLKFGPNEHRMHTPQLRVVASLMRQGIPLDDVVAQVLAATKGAVRNDERCLGWDWRKEEFGITRMGLDLICKSPELAPCLNDKLYKQWQESVERLGPGEKLSTSINFHGAFFRTPYSSRKNGPAEEPRAGGDKSKSGSESGTRAEEPRQEKKGRPPAALSAPEWLERAIPEVDCLLGNWLTTTTRAEIYAPTGIGKSMLGMAIGLAVADGGSFLHWVGYGVPKRVLYIDGEMPLRLLKRRIADECARRKCVPKTFFALNTTDIEDFHPLDDPRGRQIIEEEIKRIGGVDLIIFDNIMALISGDMRDEEAWRKTLDWQKTLTARNIAYIWIHHTGHDETKGYGTKTREWQLALVIALEKPPRGEADLSFQMIFQKKRECTPETRDDFADISVALVNNQWTHSNIRGGGKRPSPTGSQFLRALTNVLASPDAVTWNKERCATWGDWERECITLGLVDKEKAHSTRTMMSKYRRELIECHLIACDGNRNLVWLLNKMV